MVRRFKLFKNICVTCPILQDLLCLRLCSVSVMNALVLHVIDRRIWGFTSIPNVHSYWGSGLFCIFIVCHKCCNLNKNILIVDHNLYCMKLMTLYPLLESWVDVTVSGRVTPVSAPTGLINGSPVNNGGGNQGQFSAQITEEYLRLLKEAQRESNYSSSRVSLASSRRESRCES